MHRNLLDNVIINIQVLGKIESQFEQGSGSISLYFSQFYPSLEIRSVLKLTSLMVSNRNWVCMLPQSHPGEGFLKKHFLPSEVLNVSLICSSLTL